MSGDIEDEIPLLFLLPELMTIDLSENKLTSTGQFRFMKTLTNMNFEKNELTVRGGLYMCVVNPAFKGGFTFSDRISKLVFAWV